MTNSNESIIPVIPPEDHGYMHSLYERSGLELDSSAELVMAAARKAWNPDKDDVSARATAAELLLGRRVDGQELGTLPVLFSLHVFDPEDFDGFLHAVNQVAEFDVESR